MTCAWPRCPSPAANVCDQHWPMLPEDLRSQLNAWWGIDRDGSGYRNTVARVHAWVHKTFAAVEERRDPGKWERLRRMVRDRDESRRARNSAPLAEPKPVDGKPWRHLRLVRDDE